VYLVFAAWLRLPTNNTPWLHTQLHGGVLSQHSQPRILFNGSNEWQRPSREQSPLLTLTTRWRRRPPEQSLRSCQQPGALQRPTAPASLRRGSATASARLRLFLRQPKPSRPGGGRTPPETIALEPRQLLPTGGGEPSLHERLPS